MFTGEIAFQQKINVGHLSSQTDVNFNDEKLKIHHMLERVQVCHILFFVCVKGRNREKLLNFMNYVYTLYSVQSQKVTHKVLAEEEHVVIDKDGMLIGRRLIPCSLDKKYWAEPHASFFEVCTTPNCHAGLYIG